MVVLYNACKQQRVDYCRGMCPDWLVPALHRREYFDHCAFRIRRFNEMTCSQQFLFFVCASKQPFACSFVALTPLQPVVAVHADNHFDRHYYLHSFQLEAGNIVHDDALELSTEDIVDIIPNVSSRSPFHCMNL